MSHTEIKKVGIALQGGGAHGAFTWGVLDKLLEVDHLVADARYHPHYHGLTRTYL